MKVRVSSRNLIDKNIENIFKEEAESVLSYMLGDLASRNIDLRIRFTDKILLKKPKMLGYIQPLTYRPNWKFEMHILITPQEVMLKTLYHELAHVIQWVKKQMTMGNREILWHGKSYSDTDYWKKPWELSARKNEVLFYNMFVPKLNKIILLCLAQFPSRL